MRQISLTGNVYLLHFSEPYHHARHYVGFTTQETEDRLSEHLVGLGSPLVYAVIKRGVVVVVGRVWTGVTRHFERWIKNQHDTRRFCPMCRGTDSVTQLSLLYLMDPVARKEHNSRQNWADQIDLTPFIHDDSKDY